MNRSIYIALVLFLIACLIAGFFYFQEKSEIVPEEFLNDSLNNPPELAWKDITPEYFLDESIFSGNNKGTSVLGELKSSENKNHFYRTYYDESGYSFMTITVTEYDYIVPESHKRYDKVNIVKNLSENFSSTYLESFTFNGELVDKVRFDTSYENGIASAFYLQWLKDRFSFSVLFSSDNYQEEAIEAAKNIINKYSNKII